MYNLDFEKLVFYNAGEAGISIDVRLELGGRSSEFTAKLDTGATACVFNRAYGGKSELKSKRAKSRNSALRPAHFRLSGITLL